MTVAELIERLKDLPQDLRVVLEQDYGYHVLDGLYVQKRNDETADVVLTG